jgi:sugar phosphate isomerase/epimerase
MRIGTTSYIFPADIITNVRKLAGKVEDIELVLFESDEDGSSLPNNSTISEMRQIAADHGMTYTVHLPLDLYLADEMPFLESAFRVIGVTEKLQPYGYVIHLDTKKESTALDNMIENSLESLDLLTREAVPEELLCVENLENHPSGFMDSILSRTSVSACVDIGHLWKIDLDPLPCLDAWLSRAKVIHLHGFREYDHRRLSLMPAEMLDPVIQTLRRDFSGVLTLEIFKETDFLASLNALNESLSRLGSKV